MLRNVYFEGELGDKFEKKFTVKSDTIQDVFRNAEANFSGFRKYLIECEEEGIGFIIDVADSNIEAEAQLLLPIKKGDITVTPVPAGSKGIGKIIAAAVIMYLVIVSGGTGAGMWVKEGAVVAKGTADASLYAGMELVKEVGLSAVIQQMSGMQLMGMGLAVNLGMTGLMQMMAPDPATDADQESSYLFNGTEQNIIEGDPIPLLYGQLRVPGQPITFDVISSGYDPIAGGGGTGTRSTNYDFIAPDTTINSDLGHDWTTITNTLDP